VPRLEDIPVVVTRVGDEVQHHAVAVYRAPMSFDRTAEDKTLVERTAQIAARFTGDDGSTFQASVALQIRRPPVVLVHGLRVMATKLRGAVLGRRPA
jgi:hypothetical protein